MSMNKAGRLSAAVLCAVCFLVLPLSPSMGEPPGKTLYPGNVPIFRLPAEIELCGEPVPLARQDVFEMLDREFVVSVYDPAQVVMWLKRAHRYFPFIEQRLRQRNMPEDLKYVAVVESALKTYTFSPAGAVGPWQFIESTAERYGLKVDDWIDERLSFERATQASLSYLEDLNEMFGSWTLAIAAYNCGENRMISGIDQQNVCDFYDLDLPLETERYIFRILAAKRILSAPGSYGYSVPREMLYSPVECDYVEFAASKELPLLVVASACGTTVKTVREMNPELRKFTIPAGRYRLKVPKGTVARFGPDFPDSKTKDSTKSQ